MGLSNVYTSRGRVLNEKINSVNIVTYQIYSLVVMRKVVQLVAALDLNG